MSPNRVAVLGGNLLLFGYLCGLTIALARAARSCGAAELPGGLVWYMTLSNVKGGSRARAHVRLRLELGLSPETIVLGVGVRRARSERRT